MRRSFLLVPLLVAVVLSLTPFLSYITAVIEQPSSQQKNVVRDSFSCNTDPVAKVRVLEEHSSSTTLIWLECDTPWSWFDLGIGHIEGWQTLRLNVQHLMNSKDWPQLKSRASRLIPLPSDGRHVWMLARACYARNKKAGLFADWISSLKGKVRHLNSWKASDWKQEEGVSYDSSVVSSRRRMRAKHDLPIVVSDAGEYYQKAAGNDKRKREQSPEDMQFGRLAPPDADIQLNRCIQYVAPNAVNVHYVQAQQLQLDMRHSYDELLKPLEKPVQKSRFCGMIVKQLIGPGKPADTLLRTALQRYITAHYKTCELLGPARDEASEQLVQQGKLKQCTTNRTHYLSDAIRCFQPYKFTISMDNTYSKGYISEKILLSLFAGSIPIYSGAEWLDKYINMERVIDCRISEQQALRFKRDAWDAGYWEQSYPALTANSSWWLDWTIERFRPHFKKCLQKVIEIDKDETLRQKILDQPVFPRNSLKNTLWDGSELAASFKRAITLLIEGEGEQGK